MISDAFDMVGDGSLDKDADDFYKQVLEEQAMEINAEGIAVPKAKIGGEHGEGKVEDDVLMKRLDALK